MPSRVMLYTTWKSQQSRGVVHLCRQLMSNSHRPPILTELSASNKEFAVKRLLIILAAIVLLLAVAVPGFRKVLLLGAVVIIGLVLLVVFNESSTKQTPSAIDQPGLAVPPSPPPKLIPPASIEARDIRTDFPGYGRQISRVTVRLFNNSTQETLKKADFRLLIADCKNVANKVAKKSGDCVTVDDETGSFDYLNVPPQEARDVSLTVKNLGVTILGSPRIDFTVTAAQAE